MREERLDTSDAEESVHENYLSEMTNQEIQTKLLIVGLALIVIFEAIHTFLDSGASSLTDENA